MVHHRTFFVEHIRTLSLSHLRNVAAQNKSISVLNPYNALTRLNWLRMMYARIFTQTLGCPISNGLSCGPRHRLGTSHTPCWITGTESFEMKSMNSSFAIKSLVESVKTSFKLDYIRLHIMPQHALERYQTCRRLFNISDKIRSLNCICWNISETEFSSAKGDGFEALRATGRNVPQALHCERVTFRFACCSVFL